MINTLKLAIIDSLGLLFQRLEMLGVDAPWEKWERLEERWAPDRGDRDA